MSDESVVESDGRPPLERDVQEFLAGSLSSSLGERLTLIQTEYPVSFGRIDILAKDELGRFIAIELKLGTANRDAVGQLQSYMGALVQANPECFVRGILVASALDAGAQAALLVANDIQFVSFTIGSNLRTNLLLKVHTTNGLQGKRQPHPSRQRRPPRYGYPPVIRSEKTMERCRTDGNVCRVAGPAAMLHIRVHPQDADSKDVHCRVRRSE